MKRLIGFMALLLIAAFATYAKGVQPSEVLSKTVANLKKGTPINCRFKVSGPDGSITGTYVVLGQKFRMSTEQSTTWYDGVEMWTANNITKEITVVKPTGAEVRESNPFCYIDTYLSSYRLYFSSRKEKGRYLVLLNPKTKGTNIKAIEVAINEKSYMPERFIIRDTSDRVTTVTLSDITRTAVPATTFVCPVGSMKDYELVDLR